MIAGILIAFLPGGYALAADSAFEQKAKEEIAIKLQQEESRRFAEAQNPEEKVKLEEERLRTFEPRTVEEKIQLEKQRIRFSEAQSFEEKLKLVEERLGDSQARTPEEKLKLAEENLRNSDARIRDQKLKLDEARARYAEARTPEERMKLEEEGLRNSDAKSYEEKLKMDEENIINSEAQAEKDKVQLEEDRARYAESQAAQDKLNPEEAAKAQTSDEMAKQEEVRYIQEQAAARIWNRGTKPLETTVQLGRSRSLRLRSYSRGPLLLRRSGWLRHVAAGNLRLVGVLPRTDEDWKTLSPDTRSALEQAPVGVFALSDLSHCHSAGQPDEWMHAVFQAGSADGIGQRMAWKSLPHIALTNPVEP